jgi:hypothetical protein
VPFGARSVVSPAKLDRYGGPVYFWSGGIIFFLVAVLVVVGFVRVKQRDREYGAGGSQPSGTKSKRRKRK